MLLGSFCQPSPGHAQETHAREQLCLRQLHESSLEGFHPVGLSVSDDITPDPTIVMWSSGELLVVRVTGMEAQVRFPIRADTPAGVEPLAIAITSWNGRGPVVEMLDARDGAVWTVDVVAGEATRTTVERGAASASGAARDRTGWVHAQKVVDLPADTSGIMLFGRGLRIGSRMDGPSSPTVTAKRRIDRLLHVRTGHLGGFLIQEAGFPFTTIYFKDGGQEAWRVVPHPDELRRQLGESDLRYVIATPAIAVDSAVLNTFVALRSGRRIAALRSPNWPSVTYRMNPDGLAFLGAMPSHRLVVGTRLRTGQAYTLNVFRWHWIDQGQSCS